jgi:putative Mn2+ efflux pump MntP
MDYITLFAVAVGLSMDAFAVAITSGFVTKDLKMRQALKMAAFFGGFQAIMPLLGWLAGLTIRNYIQFIDHWVAFGLLSFIGIKMIYESFQIEEIEKKSCPMDTPNLLVLSVATSIDALAVGLSLSFLNTTIALPAVVIGLVTFCISFAGVWIGKKFGHLFEKRMEFIGGLILIGIGAKILLEHLLAK